MNIVCLVLEINKPKLRKHESVSKLEESKIPTRILERAKNEISKIKYEPVIKSRNNAMGLCKNNDKVFNTHSGSNVHQLNELMIFNAR